MSMFGDRRFVQLRWEETEGHVAVYNFHTRRSQTGGVTTSLWCSVRGGCEGMAYSSVWNHDWEGGQTLEQASQGSGHGPKSVNVWEGFGQCSETNGLTFWLRCVKSRIYGPPGSLPTQDLWFYEKKVLLVFCRSTEVFILLHIMTPQKPDLDPLSFVCSQYTYF